MSNNTIFNKQLEKCARIPWLDNARAFAILAVILVHATEHIYIMDATHLNAMSTQSALFAISAFSIGRLGVPIFLFLTGFLLLDRNFTGDMCKKFWRKNWLGMLITTEVWIVLYDLFLWALHLQPHWQTVALFKDMFFMTQVHMGHMWYMPMIVGIYLCIPFAARSLQKLDTKILVFPLTILSAYAFLIPVWRVINEALSFTNVGSVLNLGYSGGVFGIYIIFGYCIKKGMLSFFKKNQLLIIASMSFFLTVFLQIFSYFYGKTYNVWYNCGVLLISALFLFEYFSRIHFIGNQKWYNWLSRNSFGIYMIHFPVLMLIKKWLNCLQIILPIKVIILFAFVLITSSIFCWSINHFPRLSKILLYDR